MAHAPSSRRTIGNWEIQEVVGSGSFAIVWKARHLTTGALAAVKEILADRLNKKLHESLESEIAVLQRLKHANIVGLLDLYKEPGKIFLVLEFCGGGDLAQHLRQRGPLSEASCRYLLRHLAEGLKVLRQHNVIHRDLKPQNLLLSDNGPSPTLKIADFGFARSLQPAGLAETLCGSPLYMAPEVLQLHRYDAKADLWSVGTILFELLTGKPPFNGANHLQLVQNIERGDAVLPEHVARSLSPGCRQLLHQLLRRNPVERISFDELFAHPFLMGEAASAAATPPSTGIGAANSPFEGTGATSAVGYQDPQQQRRYTPTSHGAIRFVQPVRVVSPVHPACQVPAPSSLSPTNAQQPQQQMGPPAPGAAAAAAAGGSGVPSSPAGPPGDMTAAGAAPGSGSMVGPGLGPVAAINVRELSRSPSPRILAAAAAVATALLGDGATGGGTPGGAAPTSPASTTAAAGPNAGPGAAAAGAASSGSAPLADSLDSDYVVVASPSAASRPAVSLSPRTPHPAIVSGRGSSSAGGAPPAALAPPHGDVPFAASGDIGCAAAVSGPPMWQQLLSPIAAASLGAGPPHLTTAAAAGATGATSTASSAATAAAAAASTATSRVPQTGCDPDADDPMLLPRVVGVLLDQVRGRCSALLDQEAEARQLDESHAAAGNAGFGGGFGAGGTAAEAAGSDLADEAAAAVGTLLVACRLLVAALSAGSAAGERSGAGGGSEGGGNGSQEQPVGSRAATAGTATEASGPMPGGATPGADLMASAAASAAPSAPPPASLAALAALAVHARSVLAALDEHLHGTVARLLLGAADGSTPLPTPSTRSVAAAGAGAFPPVPAPAAPIVPCSLDTLLAAAVHHSRAAAGEELLGNAAGAVEQYRRAADVLQFLLATPQLPPVQQGGEQPAAASPQDLLLEAVRPPLGPNERQRLTKYYTAVRLRQSSAMASLGPAAASTAAAVPPSLQQPFGHHPHLAQPAQQHQHYQQQQAPGSYLHQLYQPHHYNGHVVVATIAQQGSAVGAAGPAGASGGGAYGYGRSHGYGAVVF